ncbi:Predicted CoA-binding protein [Desulfonispora thiosulfatigenes DSM 11270]|uniref:Predicted CoA-binding protein n=1 Tax=Desulfonispora thiosulfatigenes DSM 11270 TaxID=656914 RepID=A0A1W1UQD1_DESTI|nr:CoA-binding protein [Desulfonispora thiosulfatigenes]SMB83312.1 Predicted CoA-binding protein [Desulfonispora thiosulfatigenes DSM 11270]
MSGQDFLQFKNWAVCGDVLNENKYAYKITKKLEEHGYNVFKVNPRTKKEEVYTSFDDITEKVDAIDLCIHPKIGINLVKEAKELNINKILIQPGAESEEILNFCQENDIMALEGCVLVELSKKFPKDV